MPAQEVVTGLQSNYILYKTGDKHAKNRSITKADTLALPFFDDFSNHSFLPDSNKWVDNFVFINNTYSDRQNTLGIATLDALDNAGRLYESASSAGFEADHFTSQPIDLNYEASEEIWLSFFYQAGGLSDTPETKDSITLQFLAPEENKWYSVWKAEGDTMQVFKPVILRIDSSRFLKKGFQFRFINYASLSPNLNDPSMVGNCDIWNIDYILLDKNRNAGDTIFADVAFRLPLRSMLKNHESMPFKQFAKKNLQEMGFLIPIHYRNNDEIVRNVTRSFEIWDVYGNALAHFFSAGATNIDPMTNIDYNANLIYNFYNVNTVNYDSALFRITCSLKTDEFDPKGNDTLIYYQNFSNYFAFDDGSSEGGYGVNGLGSRNAMVAYRFTSFIEDTLRAISICFNDSYMDANKRTFDLMVWEDNNGIPGNAAYSLEEVMVEQGDMINGFHSYKIPGGIMINGVFYVGWKQRSETFLNAGFDVNTPHLNRQFYWINGEWRLSQVEGSIMIRPVVGAPLKTTSINDTYYHKRTIFNIWPNPATDFINIDLGDFQKSALTYLSVFDFSGRELIKVPLSERIDISSLHEGIYIITISINGRPVSYNRLIKTH